MGYNSQIPWTDNTHNFWEGCNKVDKDCLNCYAERLFGRFGKDFRTIRRTKGFNGPLKWRTPSKIFTCSTSDFFIAQADEWRADAWDIIRRCPQHIFQILTKRPERIIECLPPDWGEGWDNVWIGTSAGSQKSANERIPHLLNVPAKVLFLSIEPLHSSVNLDTIECSGIEFNCLAKTPSHKQIDWVIVGGESGNEEGKSKYRPCELSWIEKVVSDCIENDVAVFVKQMGTFLQKELKMKARHGTAISEFPEHLQVREFPNAQNTQHAIYK